VDVGALCLSSSGSRHLVGSEQNPTEASCDQDKHKAPSLPRIHPLSLQDGSGWCLSFPHSVVKDHQAYRHGVRYPGYFVKVHYARIMAFNLL